MMKSLQPFLFLTFLIFRSAWAQTPPAGTACYFNGRVYYQNVQPTPTFGLNYRYRYDPAQYYELTCTNNVYATLNSMLTVGIFNAPVNCGTSATYSLNTGTMYYISVINCPLDHLLFLLSIPITILAFYRFRKYQFE